MADLLWYAGAVSSIGLESSGKGPQGGTGLSNRGRRYWQAGPTGGKPAIASARIDVAGQPSAPLHEVQEHDAVVQELQRSGEPNHGHASRSRSAGWAIEDLSVALVEGVGHRLDVKGRVACRSPRRLVARHEQAEVLWGEGQFGQLFNRGSRR